MKRHAPATARNREPILEVLNDALRQPGRVLEIASGTGEHACFFADRLPHLEWLPSDIDPSARASIEAWRQDGPANLHPALELDAASSDWHHRDLAAIICINMVHISPWTSCQGVFAGAQRNDVPTIILYGPLFVEDVDTAPSNLAFDRSLRTRNPAWGIRKLSDVTKLAQGSGYQLTRSVTMPANNLTVIFERA